MIEFDRTSEQYSDFAIISERKTKPDVLVAGMMSNLIPQTFEELEAEVVAHRHPGCESSQDADTFIDSLRTISNRDHIVRALPANGEHIVFVLPQ